jgi:uncharacterized membrane protein
MEGRFCAKCGATAGAAAPPPQGQSAAPPPGAYAPPPAAAAPGLTDNAASALCYLLGVITGVVFLVLAPYNQNKTIRFHAFQSIFLWVACVVVMIVWSIISGIILAATGFGFGFSFLHLISLVINLAIFVFWVFMIVSAYQGKKIVLPVIGQLAEKQA